MFQCTADASLRSGLGLCVKLLIDKRSAGTDDLQICPVVVLE
jgi:hypothetical protein